MSQSTVAVAGHRTAKRMAVSLALVRWLVVGVAFMGLNTLLLWWSKERMGFPLWLGSSVSSEIVATTRFFVNDRWVFGQKRPNWSRFWQYHVANFSSFLIWLGLTNLLPLLWRAPQLFGVKTYLIASVVATICSMGWSILTNFGWVWK